MNNIEEMLNKIHNGDCLELLRQMPDESVNCCVTSPPYWGLRDYGNGEKGIGLEQTLPLYIQHLTEVFNEVRRILRADGTLWLNLGDAYCGSWGNAGHRPELDGTDSYQREKTTEYFNRGGWDENRKTPPHVKIDGLKAKDLIGMPWRIAFALQASGYYLRSDIIWSKPNPMPESVMDRPTKAHEYMFLMAKSERYYYDADAIREASKIESCERLMRGVSSDNKMVNGAPGQSPHSIHQPRLNRSGNKKRKMGVERGSPNDHLGGSIPWEGLTKNKRDVWQIPTKNYEGAHFATYPEELIEPCIKAGCPPEGVVLDPFMGSGTTGAVALRLNRNFIGLELNPEYVKLANKRIFSSSSTLDSFEEKKINAIVGD
jgi:DNA modification methylase